MLPGHVGLAKFGELEIVGITVHAVEVDKGPPGLLVGAPGARRWRSRVVVHLAGPVGGEIDVVRDGRWGVWVVAQVVL